MIFSRGKHFEGEFKNDSLIKGKITHLNGRIEEGEFKHDYLNGKGKITYPDGTIQEGEFKEGIFIQ